MSYVIQGEFRLSELQMRMIGESCLRTLAPVALGTQPSSGAWLGQTPANILTYRYLVSLAGHRTVRWYV
jgi:hypothetical protein